MASDRNDIEERQLRLDAMIEEFRAAQQRALAKRGRVQRSRAEAARQATGSLPENPN